ncbi:MAG: hypothetical protein HOO19_06820 [Rhodospirillaceae bacterium]|jgi:hypothetical protein|nr:hypothetical protein [Rhodospirillaceae bacterium]MBT3884418.1 hypothetical protein [Rhodospirillaceae bacterium]MBT4118921.1 hypothetical protein [Rhodospirillaceae bacterium]MBT4673886.1 hypothetical protein [Rhodospirillaceae bacterium]MBT4718431.1 hypothetical protein [Rhodospirillaceae bacterium]
MTDEQLSIKDQCSGALAVLKTTIGMAEGSNGEVVDAAKKLQYVLVVKLQSTPPGVDVSDSKFANLEQALEAFEAAISAAGLKPEDTPCRAEYDAALSAAAGTTDKATAGITYAACLGARFAKYLSGS